MSKEERNEIIKKRISDLKEWEKDLPEGKDYQDLIAKFESLLEE